MIELSLAFTVLAVLLAISLQMFRVVADQQRASERRNLALQAAQAITEQVGNIPWDKFTADAVNQIAIPPAIAERLPSAGLAIGINDETEPTAKRVLVEIHWNNGGGKPLSVRLASWVYPE